MKIIAAVIAVGAALMLTAGTAQAEPTVSVSCSTGVSDLTNAQVTKSPDDTYATTPPPPPATIPGSYEEPPYDAYDSSNKTARPNLYIRAFEQLPAGFGADEYLAQMRKECTVSNGYEQLPFSEDFVLAVFDTNGVIDVVVSPTLGIESRMEPIVAAFTQGIRSGDYHVAVEDFRNATNRELNKVHADRNPPQERQNPCQQEVRSVKVLEADLFSRIESVVTHSIWTMIGTALIAVLAICGLPGLFAIFVPRRSNKTDAKANSETGTDKVVDAEVVEDEDDRR